MKKIEKGVDRNGWNRFNRSDMFVLAGWMDGRGNQAITVINKLGSSSSSLG
jgi:hypothetical protein